MSFYLQEQIVELERERTALLQKCETLQEFWAHVEALLEAHQANAVQDLPQDVQRSLLEKFTRLPHEGQLRLELMRLEGKERELTNLLPQHSDKSKEAA
jgi:hypothetical protein